MTVESSVKVIFNRRHSIGSLFLRTVMWSKWSHCGIVYRNHVIEATTRGVVLTPMEKFLKDSSNYEVVEIPSKNPELVIRFALSQIGKPYDWAGLLGIGLRRKWHDADKWFCSELVAWSFKEAGEPLVRIDVWRITPQHIYIPVFDRRSNLDGR